MDRATSPVHLVWDLESLHLIQSLYFFSQNVKKITSVGSSAFQKKLQQLDQPILDPTLVLFLTSFEKNTTTGSSANFLSP